RTVFLESPAGAGPKGLGELPMDGPAPAVLNAVRHALGSAPRCIPATPDRILETLTGARDAGGGGGPEA
ncbi:MAG TPA: hypothetical protein VKU85_04155, partial [bacterium]|nr:hypothetical protein [bacterium]